MIVTRYLMIHMNYWLCGYQKEDLHTFLLIGLRKAHSARIIRINNGREEKQKRNKIAKLCHIGL